jgi:hypothetical protein
LATSTTDAPLTIDTRNKGRRTDFGEELLKKINYLDVALEIVFDSHAAHDSYQTDDRHNRFIADHSTNWAKVRVFDVDLAAFEPSAVAGRR